MPRGENLVCTGWGAHSLSWVHTACPVLPSKAEDCTRRKEERRIRKEKCQCWGDKRRASGKEEAVGQTAQPLCKHRGLPPVLPFLL